MFEGENWNDKTYAVAGDILDGYLYDLFMNMLDERGVNKEFVEKMSDYCSAYEHERYIGLLEDLQKFVKWKSFTSQRFCLWIQLYYGTLNI